MASCFTVALDFEEESRPEDRVDNEPNREVRIACKVNVDGKDEIISDQKAEYSDVLSSIFRRITGRVIWKNEGCDRDMGMVGGNTPTLTSFVKR